MHSARRAVLGLVAAVLLGVAAPAAAQTTPEAIIGSIDAYWSAQFAARGLPYSSPAVREITGPETTPCGPIDPSIGPGAYCPANQTIYYNPGFFTFAARAVGEFTTVMAHEFGHHVQWELGVAPAPPLYELQADCLAGAYVGFAQQGGEISPGDAAAGLGLSQIAGSDVNGPGNLRSISFIGGEQDGPAACGIGF